MSRSRKKLPIGGMSKAESDKTYKVAEHRAERRTARAVISARLVAALELSGVPESGEPTATR
jgi:hypothetical protein